MNTNNATLRRLNNAPEVFKVLYSSGCFSITSSRTSFSNTPEITGGILVKKVFKKVRTHESKSVCPENPLKIQ